MTDPTTELGAAIAANGTGGNTNPYMSDTPKQLGALSGRTHFLDEDDTPETPGEQTFGAPGDDRR